MISKVNFGFLTLAFVAALTATASAADDRLPTIDLEKRCRAAAAASQDMLGNRTAGEDAYKSCMTAEQEAKTALTAAWKDIPRNYRVRCIDPSVHSPSYVEWISCLELDLDAKQSRIKK